ncbi:XkdQ/YqbQ family protein [Paenibacillus gansuensis]|uniref:YqbQ/XkdQ domain-containing protein n=1 Tax=Paenibacillus gansuensis TaxID=306542 RepID=A0ABW5PGE6_9BACL
MFTMNLIKNDGSKIFNLTPIIGAVSWDSNLSLMSVLEFELFWADNTLLPKNPVDLGDVVILKQDKEEVYRGIVVTEGQADRGAMKYTVYDYAWYLGKSKSVYQFNKVPASKAILRILKDFGMLVGNVPTMNTIIDEIFLEKSPAAIIEEIYKREERRTGKRFNVEMRKGKIYFEEMKNLVIKGTFRLSELETEYDVLSNPLSASRTRTIESLRNRVKILIERDNGKENAGKAKYEVVANAEDQGLIRKYGLLEEVFKIEAEDAAKAREVSRILLQRLARVQETNTIKLIGDPAFKAGRLFDVSEPLTGMKGRFMILSVKHNVANQFHTMDLELVLPQEVK